MQPSTGEIPAMNANSLLNLPEMHNNHQNGESHFDPTSSHDDFLDQMLSSSNSSFPWEFAACQPDDQSPQANMLSHFNDQSALLVSKLRQHQIGDGVAAKGLMFQQQLMLARGLAGSGLQSPTRAESTGLLPIHSSLNGHHDVVNGSSSKSANPANDALYNEFIGSLGQTSNQPPHFNHPQGEALQAQNFGASAAPAGAMNHPTAGGGGTPPQPKPRVRARRGQATDPHSIAERLRRERIAERMKALQELVPNANKTDKASMLDEIIDYVKFLQLQVKVLSVSRMGNAAAIAPRVADISSEGRSGNGNNDGMKATEQQVAKLLEEDMGSAMQYLQGKGLCLMPISLATAVASVTSQSRNPLAGGPPSPSMSVLTAQSAAAGGNGRDEAFRKDTTPSICSKP